MTVLTRSVLASGDLIYEPHAVIDLTDAER
jgi:hypothetical protein